MYVPLAKLAIPQHLLHLIEACTEKILIELLKAGTSNRCEEVNALVEGVDLNCCRGR